MTGFFHGESEMREPSSDVFMMNLNPFPDPTTIINAQNSHFYNLCFGSEQHPRRVSKDEVYHIEHGNSSIATVSYGGVTQSFGDLAPTYLKSAQELLNEIVNVGNSSRGVKQEQHMNLIYEKYKRVGDINGGHKPCVGADRQELQIKKAKLISMAERVIFVFYAL